VRIEGSNRFTIRNNRLHGINPTVNVGNNPQNHAAIMIYTSTNGTIENNEIYDSFTCIFPKGRHGGHKIRFNHIHDCAKCLRISYHENMDVYQNIFENCTDLVFQPAESIADIRIYNNVFASSASGVNNWFASGGFLLWNNIYLDVVKPFDFEGDIGSFTSRNNDYFSYADFHVSRSIGRLAEWQARGYDLGSIEVNPMFDATYHLPERLSLALSRRGSAGPRR
jgi:hypothetical protein